MQFSRRMVLAGAGATASFLAAPPSESCTLFGKRKPISFSDAECRRSLRKLVELINKAPSLSDTELSTAAAELGITFDDTVSDLILNYPQVHPIKDTDLIRGWGVSDGKPDRSPVKLLEINLLKGGLGIALYQFTLRRETYHREVTAEEAANDSCGMGSVEAFFGRDDASYLGVFVNNGLHEVTAFDAWLRTA